MKILFPDLRSYGGGFTFKGESFRSVSQALRVLPTDLDVWAARVAAEYALDHAAELGETTRQRALIRCSAEAKTVAHRASKVGVDVHRAVRAHLLGEPITDTAFRTEEAKERFEQFLQFETDYRPEWWAAEATVFNRQHSYAGTIDLLAVINGATVLIDVKATRTLQPRVAVQLAALARAEFLPGPDGTEYPMPEIHTCAALHLLQDRYDLVRVDAGPSAFRAFRAALYGVAPWVETAHESLLGNIRAPQKAEANAN